MNIFEQKVGKKLERVEGKKLDLLLYRKIKFCKLETKCCKTKLDKKSEKMRKKVKKKTEKRSEKKWGKSRG